MSWRVLKRRKRVKKPKRDQGGWGGLVVKRVKEMKRGVELKKLCRST